MGLQLALSANEQLIISDDVCVTVLKIGENRVVVDVFTQPDKQEVIRFPVHAQNLEQNDPRLKMLRSNRNDI